MPNRLVEDSLPHTTHHRILVHDAPTYQAINPPNAKIIVTDGKSMMLNNIGDK